MRQTQYVAEQLSDTTVYLLDMESRVKSVLLNKSDYNPQNVLLFKTMWRAKNARLVLKYRDGKLVRKQKHWKILIKTWLEEKLNERFKDDNKVVLTHNVGGRLAVVKAEEKKLMDINAMVNALEVILAMLQSLLIKHITTPQNQGIWNMITSRVNTTKHITHPNLRLLKGALTTSESTNIEQELSLVWSILMQEFQLSSMTDFQLTFNQVTDSSKLDTTRDINVYLTICNDLLNLMRNKGLIKYFNYYVFATHQMIDHWHEEDARRKAWEHFQQVIDTVPAEELQGAKGQTVFDDIQQILHTESKLIAQSRVGGRSSGGGKSGGSSGGGSSGGGNSGGRGTGGGRGQGGRGSDAQAHAAVTNVVVGTEIQVDGVKYFYWSDKLMATVAKPLKKTSTYSDNILVRTYSSTNNQPAKWHRYSYMAQPAKCPTCDDEDVSKRHNPKCYQMDCSKCKLWGHRHHLCLQEVKPGGK
jgi:uncharacterized membrane protein YgcG